MRYKCTCLEIFIKRQLLSLGVLKILLLILDMN